MDSRQDKGISVMKKMIGLFLIGMVVIFAVTLWGRVSSAVKSGGVFQLTEMFSGMEEGISGALENADSEQVKEMFDFVKDKMSTGNLGTEEGLSTAIAEGEERFGVSIDKDSARQVVKVMEQLEDMGFSGEEMVDRAKGLYEEYGADFMEHMKDEFTEAIEQTVSGAADDFWNHLVNTVKDVPKNLAEGF